MWICICEGVSDLGFPSEYKGSGSDANRYASFECIFKFIDVWITLDIEILLMLLGYCIHVAMIRYCSQIVLNWKCFLGCLIHYNVTFMVGLI